MVGRAFLILWPPSRFRVLPIPATFTKLNTGQALGARAIGELATPAAPLVAGRVGRRAPDLAGPAAARAGSKRAERRWRRDRGGRAVAGPPGEAPVTTWRCLGGGIPAIPPGVRQD